MMKSKFFTYRNHRILCTSLLLMFAAIGTPLVESHAQGLESIPFHKSGFEDCRSANPSPTVTFTCELRKIINASGIFQSLIRRIDMRNIDTEEENFIDGSALSSSYVAFSSQLGLGDHKPTLSLHLTSSCSYKDQSIRFIIPAYIWFLTLTEREYKKWYNSDNNTNAISQWFSLKKNSDKKPTNNIQEKTAVLGLGNQAGKNVRTQIQFGDQSPINMTTEENQNFLQRLFLGLQLQAFHARDQAIQTLGTFHDSENVKQAIIDLNFLYKEKEQGSLNLSRGSTGKPFNPELLSETSHISGVPEPFDASQLDGPIEPQSQEKDLCSWIEKLGQKTENLK
ncbi:MAG: hypothetical protein KDD52_03555 [Bdellovibrionales bacterium]|nr:hypothetical protein [Bdellovibrionales bacterium]